VRGGASYVSEPRKKPGARKRLVLTGFALAGLLTRFAGLDDPMAQRGRPRKDPLRLRAVQVSVRFSPEEHQKLCLLAALHRVPLRQYVRDAALNRQLPAPMPSVNEAVHRELCRIGSNINQLTHLAHVGQAYPGIASTLRTLSDLLLSVKALLRPPTRR